MEDKLLQLLREEAHRLERRLRAVRSAIGDLAGGSGSHHGALSGKPPAAPAKKQRVLSAETRAKLSAAAKKGWKLRNKAAAPKA